MALATPTRLADLAASLGREVDGDGDFEVRGVAALDQAAAHDLSFVRSAGWADSAASSVAGALIAPKGIDLGARPVIRSPLPALDFARAVERLVPDPTHAPGVHPSARVDPTAKVDASAVIAAGAIVGPGASIGAGSVLHPNSTLYADVCVGADCILHAGVVVRESCVIGDRVRLQPGAIVGGDGFGYVHDEQGRFQRVPQVGIVVIEDDVEIGAGTTVDRATLGETRIRRGAKIDNLVQIAHNCDIGEDAIIVAQTGLSGSTVVGRGAMVMAQAGSAGHLRIGERAFVGARAGLHKDVAPGARVWGSPQLEERSWHRAMAALVRLPGALRRLRAIERRLGMRDRASAESARGEDAVKPPDEGE